MGSLKSAVEESSRTAKKERAAAARAAFAATVDGATATFKAAAGAKRAALERKVAALAKAGQLPDATLDADGLRITPLRAEGPPEARRLAADAYALLPRIRITADSGACRPPIPI